LVGSLLGFFAKYIDGLVANIFAILFDRLRLGWICQDFLQCGNEDVFWCKLHFI